MLLLLFAELNEEERITVTALFEAYGAELYRFACSILRNSHAAEEVVQDAFLVLVSEPRRMKRRTTEELRRYLYITVKYEAMRVYERMKREEPTADETVFAEIERQSAEDRENIAVIGTVEIGPRADALIEHLDESEREILQLKYGECLTNTEIAELFGISYGAVSARLSRVYKKLRGVIESGAAV